MFISGPQISSIRWGCMKKNDRNEINSVDDHRVWLCIRVTFFSSIGKVFGSPADWFVLTQFEVLLADFLMLLGMAPLSKELFLTSPSHLLWLQISYPICFFVEVNVAFKNWGHIMTVPVSSSETLTTLEYTIMQTQDMAPQPVTVYRHGSDLSLCYPLMVVVITTFLSWKVLHNAGSVQPCIIILGRKWNLNPLQQYQKG